MKGILNLKGDNEQFLLQGVHWDFEGRPGRSWGANEDRVNRVVLMADGYIGQMMEPVEFPETAVEPPTPSWAVTGTPETRHNLINSLHLEQDELEAHNRALESKYREVEMREVRAEHFHTGDAQIVLDRLEEREDDAAIDVAEEVDQREQAERVERVRPRARRAHWSGYCGSMPPTTGMAGRSSRARITMSAASRGSSVMRKSSRSGSLTLPSRTTVSLSHCTRPLQ